MNPEPRTPKPKLMHIHQQKNKKSTRLPRLQIRLTRKVGLNSIQGRLTAIAFFFIVATAGTMGVAGYRFSSAFENQRFHDHFTLLATYMANNAELGVLLGNEKMLVRLTDSMLQMNDVQSVTILDKDDNVIIYKEHGQQVAEQGRATAPVISRAIDEEPFFFHSEICDQQLGQVIITYSLGSLLQLQKHLAQRFALISLLLALAPVGMYWMLSRAINAPLQQLVKLAKQVCRGQMDLRAHGGSLQETRALARAINEMLDTLAIRRRELREANAVMARQQVLAEVGRFSMIVAHEIKNPLAIIKGSLTILAKKETVAPAMKQRMIDFAADEVVRMNKLVEDFLLFATPRTLALQPVSAANLVDNLEQRLKLISNAIHIRRETISHEYNVELQCDIAQFERALFNVVRNAIEASDSPDQVRVVIMSTATHLLFRVYDNGSGIRNDDLTAIFDPFFSTKSKGTGLGLAIAREIMTAHGGTITAKNQSGGGACFVLQLPILIQKEEVRIRN